MSTTPRAVGPRSPETGDAVRDQRGNRYGRLSAPVQEFLTRHHRKLLALTPGVVYLAIRLFGLLVLSWLSTANGESLEGNLKSWDGQWYLEVAEHGYGGVNPSMADGYGHRYPETPLAFFPGYPLLVRLFAFLPGVSAAGAAVTVSILAGIVGAYGLVRLGRLVGGSRRVGLLFVVLFAASPMSVVLSMAYSEALFCALSIWALIGVLERNWMLAGLACAAAGTTRPTASALIAVVGLAALIAIIRRRDSWRPWLAAVLAPAGMLIYVGWVAIQTGNPTGYFELQQRGWSSSFDGGFETLKFGLEALATEKSAFETFTLWICIASLVLLALCLRQRLPWPLVVFAAAVLALDLGADGLMYSKVRLMLPAFPLLLPIAIGLANRRTATAAYTTVLIVCFGTWFGAYSLTAWSYAI